MTKRGERDGGGHKVELRYLNNGGKKNQGADGEPGAGQGGGRGRTDTGHVWRNQTRGAGHREEAVKDGGWQVWEKSRRCASLHIGRGVGSGVQGVR